MKNSGHVKGVKSTEMWILCELEHSLKQESANPEFEATTNVVYETYIHIDSGNEKCDGKWMSPIMFTIAWRMTTTCLRRRIPQKQLEPPRHNVILSSQRKWKTQRSQGSTLTGTNTMINLSKARRSWRKWRDTELHYNGRSAHARVSPVKTSVVIWRKCRKVLQDMSNIPQKLRDRHHELPGESKLEVWRLLCGGA